MNNEKTKIRGKSTHVIYRLLAVFIIVYGLVGFVFYLIALISPVFTSHYPTFLGYNSFKPEALIFMLVLLLFLYGSIVVDGILFLLFSSFALRGYFFILLIYYSVSIWITGTIDIISFFAELIVGFLLLLFFRRITGRDKG